MRSRLEVMIEGLSRSDRESDASGWSPAVDIFETGEATYLVVELAGVKRDDIKILVDGEVVRIFGHRPSPGRAGGVRYHRMEIDSGGFVRSFRIAVPFVPAQIKASYEDGLLTVELPKPANPQHHKINVERA